MFQPLRRKWSILCIAPPPDDELLFVHAATLRSGVRVHNLLDVWHFPHAQGTGLLGLHQEMVILTSSSAFECSDCSDAFERPSLGQRGSCRRPGLSARLKHHLLLDGRVFLA